MPPTSSHTVVADRVPSMHPKEVDIVTGHPLASESSCIQASDSFRMCSVRKPHTAEALAVLWPPGLGID